VAGPGQQAPVPFINETVLKLKQTHICPSHSDAMLF
jgi:hypothetical protein